ncbi:MAG: hypothetical protein R2748_20305 [Bryobacterales bacterium]
MDPRHKYNQILRRNWTKPMSRRALLRDGALGFGALGLAGLLAEQGYAAPRRIRWSLARRTSRRAPSR